MKRSVKGQQALATMTCLALRYEAGKQVPAPSIAEYIGTSKLNLEQVLSLLRRAELVQAVKGAQGGYRLSRPPDQITAADILMAVEPDLFAPVDHLNGPDAILKTVIDTWVHQKLDLVVRHQLESVCLLDLIESYHRLADESGYMFYI